MGEPVKLANKEKGFATPFPTRPNNEKRLPTPTLIPMSKQAVMSTPHLNHLVMALEMPIWTLSQKWIDQSPSVNLFLATPDKPGDIPHRNLNRPPAAPGTKASKPPTTSAPSKPPISKRPAST